MLADNQEAKIIWITGASSGIGLDLALKFLRCNHTVIACSRTPGMLPTDNPKLHFINLDVTDKTSVINCIDEIKNKFRYIDIAILNAGICEYIDLPNFDVDSIRRNFEVNFFGMVNCIQACLPLLEQSNIGQLVGVSSSAGYLPFPRAQGYGASKAAATYMLKSLQADLYKSKIKISIVLPGFVKTPLTDKNSFPMPFIVSSEYASEYMYHAIINKKPIIEFPKRLIWALKFISVLPYSFQIKILAGLSNNK